MPKASGGWRLVLDLSTLNAFLRNVTFKMETPASLRDAMHPGNWPASIDLRDAYFHLIHPRDLKWLRFVWRDKVFQFRALPFGLASSPWIFTKVTRELCLRVRARVIRLRVYLDNWLVLASSPELCSRHCQQVLHLCCTLGFSLNEEKSYLRPSQQFEFLGMTFDTLQWLVFPAPHRIQCLQSLLSSLLHRDLATARELASLLGQMESFAPLVPWAAFTSASFSATSKTTGLRLAVPRISTSHWAIGFTSPPASGARSNGSLRGFLLRSRPPGTPVHRRLGTGVGGTCGPPHIFRPLAGAHDVLSHQPSGTGGCLLCTQTVSPLSGRQESPPPHRQHDGVMLHQQARDSPFSGTLTQNGGASHVVCQSVHSVVSPVCSGQVEHSSRPSQSTTHGPAVGIDSRACSAQANLVSLVHTSHRPLCHSVQSSCATVCVPNPRPGTLGSGRPVHTVVKSPVLCLPIDSHHRKGSQKGKRRKGPPSF